MATRLDVAPEGSDFPDQDTTQQPTRTGGVIQRLDPYTEPVTISEPVDIPEPVIIQDQDQDQDQDQVPQPEGNNEPFPYDPNLPQPIIIMDDEIDPDTPPGEEVLVEPMAPLPEDMAPPENPFTAGEGQVTLPPSSPQTVTNPVAGMVQANESPDPESEDAFQPAPSAIQLDQATLVTVLVAILVVALLLRTLDGR